MSGPSPITAQTDLTSVVLLANGKDVSGAYEVMAVEVEQGVFRIARAKLTLRDGDAADEQFKGSASADFAPGSEIEIQAGYHGRVAPVFKGIVWGQRLRVFGENTTVLVVDCRDKAVKSTARRRFACFTDQTDGAVIQSVLEKYGVKVNVSGATDQHACLTQWDSTDWDFAMIRAQVNGCIAFAADGVVTVAKPRTSAAASLSVAFGDDILDFDVRLDSLSQISSAEADAWNPGEQQIRTGSTSAADFNPLGSDSSSSLAHLVGDDVAVHKTAADLDAAELKAFSAAAVSWAELSKITGTIRFQGSSSVHPGGMIELAGLGKRFNGQGFIGGVRHQIREGVWTTQVRLGIDPAWFAALPNVSPPPAAGLTPPVRGLQPGLVKAISDDPDQGYRVQVQLPIIGDEANLLWARLANFYASNRFGGFFYPEIGDEVVLGFFNEDPRFPVILGFLYSKARPPAFVPDEPNTLKAIVTRSDLRLVLDETKKSILLKTPAGNQVLLNEDEKAIQVDDQNGNQIKLSPSGIAMSSPKNIEITAQGSIKISSSLGMTLSSQASISAQAPSISLSADMDLTASGNMNTSLTSDGTTIIKGGLVMIN